MRHGVPRLLIAATVFGFACLALAGLGRPPAARAAYDPSGGWMAMTTLTETFLAAHQITLTGQIVNDCKSSLPSGSTFEFLFDNVEIGSFTITSALGHDGTQNFNIPATIGKLPPPPRNITSLDFRIVLPSAGFDGKTSPCLPTFVPGTPG